MIIALLYHVTVRLLSARRAEITLTPSFLGRFLRRRVRIGIAYRAYDRFDKVCWWWKTTTEYVGKYIESYIAASPLMLVEDMSVEQLLLEASEPKRNTR